MKTKTKRKPAKTHWLVLIRHSMEDLPVAIFDGLLAKQNAYRYAKDCDPMGSETVREAMRTDCSTPSCVWVCKFEAGLLVAGEMVRTVED